jgi:hypothetical protein
MVKYDDNTKMPFGTHKGIALANVPAKYLLWCLDNLSNLSEPLKNYIKANKDVLEAEAKRSARNNAR